MHIPRINGWIIIAAIYAAAVVLIAVSNTDPVTAAGITLSFTALIALYWAPTLTAMHRHVHAIGQVVIVNLFLGWTIIGWVVALAMAYRTNHESRLA